MKKTASTWLLKFGGVAILLILWQMAFSAELLNRTLLPSPKESFYQLVILLFEGNALPDIASTLGRTFVGFFLAVIFGVVLGMLLGAFRFVYESMSMLVDFFRSIPVTALYPIFVLFFGVGNMSKIAMVFVAALFVIMLNTAYGVRYANPSRINMAKLYGANKWQILVWVTFFNALPHIVVGLRIAISYCLIVAIVAEMFMGSDLGIGQRIFEAYNTYSIDELYAFIIIVGAIGYSMNLALLKIEERVTSWISK